MSNPRGSLSVVITVLGLAIGLAACAKTQSLVQTRRADLEPVAPGQPGFDVERIDGIVPGLTVQEQIRDWFGEPDARMQRHDGTSAWVYNKARLREEDPRRAARRKREKEKMRAAQARQLREETIALVNAGRRQVGRFGDWVDRTLFYPPRPIRAGAPVVAEPPAEEAPPGAKPLPWRAETADSPGLRAAEEEDTQPAMRFDLAVTFTREGVVDEYRYQRTAGREFIP